MPGHDSARIRTTSSLERNRVHNPDWSPLSQTDLDLNLH